MRLRLVFTEDDFSVLPRLIRIFVGGITPQRNKDGINLTQEKTLLMISHHEGETLSELSRFSELDKGALSRVFKSLEEKSFIRPERDEDDRRLYHIFLTEEGKALTEKTKRKLSENINRVLAPLPVQQKKKMKAALETLQELTITLESTNR